MAFSKREVYLLIFLLILGLFLRFQQLGYSHFYGDESKILYLRKDISAKDFFLDQRKGPMQFIVAWGVEKVTGGFDEGNVRLPFAIAGLAAVFVLYFVVRELYGYQVAFWASLMMVLNGFFIAFSRTAQYQSLLLLFGLFSVFCALVYLREEKRTQRSRFLLFLTGISLSLAYLSHYDAVFYDLVVGLILLKVLIRNSDELKEIFLYLVVPFLVLVGIYYIPYFMNGYFENNTFNYILRRASGESYLKSHSLATFLSYNPLYLGLIPLGFSFLSFRNKFTWKEDIVFIWFVVPFVLFEILILNPGTHVLHYYIPLFILAALGINMAFERLKEDVLFRKALSAFLFTVFVGMFFVNSLVYIPLFNSGFPWKDTKILGLNLNKVDKKYNLFLYGFPYYRGWDFVAERNKELGIRSFYTNDNVTVGEYYLHGVPAVIPRKGDIPEYYIEVDAGQEFTPADDEFLKQYELVEIYNFSNEYAPTRLYKLK